MTPIGNNMQAGKLRHQIIIQENQYPQDELGKAQRDSYGAPIDHWVNIWTCRASIEPLSGKEYFAAQQIQAEQMTRFRIRYPHFQIWPGMRIKYRDPVLNADRYFNINSVIDQNEMHVDLFIMATELIKPLTVTGGESGSSPSGGESSPSAPESGFESGTESGTESEPEPDPFPNVIISESFEAAPGYDDPNWEEDSWGGTVDPDAAAPTTGWGSQSCRLKVDWDPVRGHADYAGIMIENWPGYLTHADFYFEFYLNNMTGSIDNKNQLCILYYLSDKSIEIYVKKVGTGYQIGLAEANVNWWWCDTVFQLQEKVSAEIIINQAGYFEWKVNGAVVSTFTSECTPGTFYFYADNYEFDSVDVYVDNLEIHSV
jgi:SPP1 family predicted phage head-tail adaptor